MPSLKFTADEKELADAMASRPKLEQVQWQLDAVAHFFLSQGELLNIYSSFINQLENSLAMIASLTVSNQQFQIMQERLLKSRGQTLQSLLIMPVQRVTRYHLFVKELIKLTADAGDINTKLKEAHAALTSVDKSINECKRRSEQRAALLLLHQRLGSASWTGVEKSHVHEYSRLLRSLQEGSVNPQGQRVEIHLLADPSLLLICHEAPDGSVSVFAAGPSIHIATHTGAPADATVDWNAVSVTIPPTHYSDWIGELKILDFNV